LFALLLLQIFHLQNATFHLQKWLLVYKVSLLDYKDGIWNYKMSSRLTTQLIERQPIQMQT